MRRGVVWMLIAAVVAAGVFSWPGWPVLGATYALALAGVGGFHYAFACRRCGNTACAMNARSPEFILRLKPQPVRPEDERRLDGGEYSDLDAKIAGLPLVVVVVLGLYGTWLYSPLAAAVVFATIATGLAGYSRVTCTGCGNSCPGNRNAAYKHWKATRDEADRARVSGR